MKILITVVSAVVLLASHTSSIATGMSETSLISVNGNKQVVLSSLNLMNNGRNNRLRVHDNVIDQFSVRSHKEHIVFKTDEPKGRNFDAPFIGPENPVAQYYLKKYLENSQLHVSQAF